MECPKLHIDSSSTLRVIHSKKAQKPLKKTLDYYPFGLKQKGYNNTIQGGNSLAQNFKYNGMELNSEMGLEWYDFGARNYDPALGRWMNIDPLAENSRRWTPYNYAYNNPIYFIDPDGMQATDWYENADGGIEFDKDIKSQEDLDKAGIEGKYIAESFVGKDQNDSLFVFNSDGEVSKSDATVVDLDSQGFDTSGFVDIESTELGNKSDENMQAAGAVVLSTKNPIQGVVNAVTSTALLITAAVQINTSDDMQYSFAKSKSGDSGDVSGAEHTSGKRKSTKKKHEKGQKRKQQKNRDKKRMETKS